MRPDNRHIARFLRSGPMRGLGKALLGPPPVVGLLNLGRYVLDYRRFANLSGDKAALVDAYPCLMDATAETGFDSHYFYQAAWLARQFARQKPAFHVDFGSSLSAIGVTSGFVPTVFVDLRPVHANLPGLEVVQADLTHLPLNDSSLMSASCLHVIEHVGLGRYGDTIDPNGHRKAAEALVRLMAPRGRLYISTPIGRPRVCFNAHRVFAPSTILEVFAGTECVDFAFVDNFGCLRPSACTDEANNLDYGCGLYVFEKK